ncbi:hypothetical protein ACO0RG_003875 [Hanseniaspora osmophila]
MADITNDFQIQVGKFPQTAAVIQSERKFQAPLDTFNKECYELWHHLQEVHYLVTEVEPLYLDEKAMSAVEKDEFDDEMRFQLQQYLEKLKFLENYEKQRTQSIIKKKNAISISNLFHKDPLKNLDTENYQMLLVQHRSGVLKSMQLKLIELSQKLGNLQSKRLALHQGALAVDFEQARKSAFSTANALHDFNGIPTELRSGLEKDVLTNSDEQDIAPLADVHQSPIIETTREEVQEYEQTMKQLTQEQIQLLESDHEDILNFKNQQLHEVENLNKTIMGIAVLQNELAIHLQTQSDTINTIMDNHDTVHVDILQANKNLKKAGRAGGYSAKMVSTMAIVFGLLILFLDFIN